MSIYSDELYHIGIKLGTKFKNHKYIARIETKPGKYLYFYNMDEYNAWRNGAKNKLQEVGNRAKAKGQELKTRLNNVANKQMQRIKPVVDTAKGKVNAATKAAVRETVNAKNQALNTASKAAVNAKTFAAVKAEKVKTSVNQGRKALLDEASIAKTEAKAKVEKIRSNVSDGRDAVLNEAKSVSANVKGVTDKAISDGKKLALTASSNAKTAAKAAIDKAKSFVDNKSKLTFNGEISPYTKARAEAFASNLAKAYVKFTSEGIYDIVNRRSKDSIGAKITKSTDGKSLATIEYDDGTTAYITSKNQWRRFSEIVKYQLNEQEFMHSLPEIKVGSDGKLPTKTQDRAAVNDKLGQQGEKYRDTNCVYCSTAYELRRRGYDVEAANLPSTVTATNISSLYKMRDSVAVHKDTVIDLDEPAEHVSSLYGTMKYLGQKKTDGKYRYVLSHTDVENNDDHIKSFVMGTSMKSAFNKNSEEFAKESVDTLTKTINNFPDDSRGMLNVYWQVGGGHSMVWEKDKSGKVFVYDTQRDSSKPLDLEELMKSVDVTAPVQVVRTDDAKLSRKALNVIQSN